MRTLLLTLASGISFGVVNAQQTIGSVGLQDASTAGALQVTGGRVLLTGSSTVTAKDHTAEITLSRGGTVRVCATSGLHVSAGKTATGVQPLMLALDRGAIELKMDALSNDFILTPDLRFAIQSAGPLDLRLRVTRNGDTCVENRGNNAPLLHVGDQFGEASYDLRPGQHVLFEHGSLKEVVDHESSPCGCPPEPIVSVADSGVSSGTAAAPGNLAVAKQAEEQHPFPAAVSQGLAPTAPAAATATGTAQVATTLTYDAAATPAIPTYPVPDSSGTSGGGTAAGGAAPASSIASVSSSTAGSASPPGVSLPANAPPSPVRAEAPPPPAAPSAPDLAHRIGRFFKRLFGKG